MSEVCIRRYTDADAEAVSALIAYTLRTMNIRDYSSDYIEADVAQLQPEQIRGRAAWMHFYVACEEDRIVGCGASGPYWGREDESSLFTIFVHPEREGQGIGRRIIAALEQDEYFLRARRIEIPASITGLGFYRKMGYDFKNGVDHVDDEQLYRLEKFRERRSGAI